MDAVNISRMVSILLLLVTPMQLFSLTGVAWGQTKRSNPVKVTGKVVFGNYEFKPPLGYWYFERRFPIDGIKKGESLTVTFFESRNDAMSSPEQLIESKKTLINFMVFGNMFKDYLSYERYNAEVYKANGISEKKIVDRELPEDLKKMLHKIPGWCCKESIANYYEPQSQVECILLTGKEAVKFSIISGNEKKMLDKTPMLFDMMKSLRHRGGNNKEVK